MKLMVHNHEVEGDGDALHALHEISMEEAERLFRDAKHQHEVHFEADVHGTTQSFVLVRENDGTHRVDFEGKPSAKRSSWF